jgi:hypothetical protein
MTYRFHTVDFTQGYINLPGDLTKVVDPRSEDGISFADPITA